MDQLAFKAGKNRKILKAWEGYLYILPTLLLMMILLVIPIFMVIQYSMFDNAIITENPVFVGFSNYIKVINDKVFIKALSNTMVFVFGSIIIHLILGMGFALILNTKYLPNRVKGIFRVVYSLPWMFTASVIAILWKLMLSPNGVVNYCLQLFNLSDVPLEFLSSRKYTLMSVTFINIWAGYPFYMISILAGLQGISKDYYEASAIDGANGFKQFTKITIPQLKPILISLIMLDFVWTLQQFALIWMTTGGGPINASETLSTYVYKTGFTKYQYAQASAVAVIILVVCIIVGILYVRNQRKG